ncbi:MAG: GIY-YIG nuclease family protein [Gracilimonas sp.]|uniref:GIY-YIG nuclease family protein n=1 Tax=Gracilimonas TaxID=649462 RepID=UPI001B04EE6D|nr:GIY-YIG nuclease family protein [Gracilimonas sp.]MBO6586839.1 GIY-YIG nuclease family protein [Gracilimonas sp.]MBO6614673.1 GIY-YIG nuclease family protein [Gracilimonas sp.]
MGHYTYIVTNPKKTTLYTGVTYDVRKRIIEHYLNRGESNTFAGKYHCYCLIWYEAFPTMREAIEAEKRIKGRSRKWKEALINEENPGWNCLNKVVLGEWPPKHTLPDRKSS